MPEAGEGQNFFTKKFFGIPAIVWILGAVLLAYLFFRSKSGSSGTASTSGGGGTSTTGNISLKPPTITVIEQYGKSPRHVAEPPKHRTPNPQPKPQPKPAKKVTQTTKHLYTVRSGDTLASIAHKYHISIAKLAHANAYVPGEAAGKKPGTTLGTGAGLKTGQKLIIPLWKWVETVSR